MQAVPDWWGMDARGFTVASDTHPYDRISEEDLIGQGSLKWTHFPGTLPAFVAEMDFPLAPAISEALAGSAQREQYGYLPEPLKRDMREATKDFLHANYQWEVPAESIYPTGDVLAAYEVVIRRLVTPGTPIIVPTPAYMPFLTLTAQLDHPVIQVPMLDLEGERPTLDLDTIGLHLQGEAELVVLCNPHNPLGIVHTEDELRALAAVVERYGGLVFSDEIHAPLVFGDKRHIPYATMSADAAAHSITATSASKAWNLPGLKCAQLIVTAEHHQKVLKPLEFTVTHSASTPGVLATTAAYRDGGDWLVELKDYLQGNLDMIGQFQKEHLPGANYRIPEGTYIAWLDARSVTLGDSPNAAEYFREHAKVSLTDGASCGEAGVGHVRLIAATPTPILEKILQRLSEHWVVA